MYKSYLLMWSVKNLDGSRNSKGIHEKYGFDHGNVLVLENCT